MVTANLFTAALSHQITGSGHQQQQNNNSHIHVHVLHGASTKRWILERLDQKAVHHITVHS
jgi:hypothetical protein